MILKGYDYALLNVIYLNWTFKKHKILWIDFEIMGNGFAASQCHHSWQPSLIASTTISIFYDSTKTLVRNLNIEHTNQPTLHLSTTVNWSILGKLRWFTWSLSCNSFLRSLFSMFHVPLKWFQFTESKIFLSVEAIFDQDFVFTFFVRKRY